MKPALTTLALVLALAVPPFATAQSAGQSPTAVPAQPRTQTDVPASIDGPNHTEPAEPPFGQWISVTTADRIIGRMLRGEDGRMAGRIEGMMIDLSAGNAVQALVGSAGDLNIGDDYVAVPMTSLNLLSSAGDGPIQANLPFDRIAHATRIDGRRVGDLSDERNRISRLYGAYGDRPPGALGNASRLGSNQLADNYVDINPYQLTRLGPNLVRDTRGQMVEHENGQEIGEIDQIMIDRSTARIAYLLLSKDSFLGIGGGWIPIPPEIIHWDPRKNAFVLKETGIQAQEMSALARTELPARVRRSEVETLYHRFNLTPYWLRPAVRSGTANAARSPSPNQAQ
ncbi:MAG: PRC-barrel domain-containing protein [Acetobacteraceae bacterium]